MRILQLVVSSPRTVALLVLLALLPALNTLYDFKSGQSRVRIDPSLEALLPRHSDALDLYQRTRARFGSDDVLLIAWLADDLFSPQRLAALKRLTQRLERMPGVEHVDSLASALNIRIKDDATDINKFLRVLPADQAAADALRVEALANPLFVGRLVSKDGRGALLAVQYDQALDPDALAALLAGIGRASQEEAGTVQQFLTGPLVVRMEISRLLLRDLYRVMPLAIALTLLMAAVSFRSVRGVLLPLVANGAALVGTLACYMATGHALNFVTVMLPPVVYVVGFAYSVHVVSSFDHEFASGLDQRAAVRAAVQEVLMPLTLTSLTTAIGFASLAVTDIVSIRDFGLFATLGSVMAWISALVVVPAGLMLLPARRPRLQKTDWFETVAPRLARFDLRHRRSILWAGAVLAIASLLAASRIEVSTDYLRNFPADSAIRVGFDKVNAAFSGAVPLQIVLESDIADAFKQPVNLRVIADLEHWLAAQPEVGGAFTLVDYLGVLHKALAPELARQDAIPHSAGLVDHLLLMGGSDDVERFVDARYTTTVLHINTSAASTADLNRLGQRIDARLALLPSHLRGHVTGSSYVIARTIDNVARSQIYSLATAVLAIYVVLAILFGSLRVAVLALVPNMLPILVYFGVLGASGITLNLTTSLIADVVLGIAVDETIHFMSRYNIAARKAASEQIGISVALRAVLRPATFTTASLCVGFLALTAGALHYQVEFGLLAAATLAISWMLYLTLTPALSERLRVVTLWEVLTLDLGASPDKTIPVFAGLSPRQARVAALMGAIEHHGAGTRVMHKDEAASDLWIVIDGELKVTKPGDDGDVFLTRAKRGDLLGEVGLFQGSRSANVDTLTDVRVLRYSEATLKTLQNRYPRVGAQVYRNLAQVLAGRLTKLTERME